MIYKDLEAVDLWQIIPPCFYRITNKNDADMIQKFFILGKKEKIKTSAI